jgi:hypothetical protein
MDAAIDRCQDLIIKARRTKRDVILILRAHVMQEKDTLAYFEKMDIAFPRPHIKSLIEDTKTHIRSMEQTIELLETK